MFRDSHICYLANSDAAVIADCVAIIVFPFAPLLQELSERKISSVCHCDFNFTGKTTPCRVAFHYIQLGFRRICFLPVGQLTMKPSRMEGRLSPRALVRSSSPLAGFVRLHLLDQHL